MKTVLCIATALLMLGCGTQSQPSQKFVKNEVEVTLNFTEDGKLASFIVSEGRNQFIANLDKSEPVSYLVASEHEVHEVNMFAGGEVASLRLESPSGRYYGTATGKTIGGTLQLNWEPKGTFSQGPSDPGAFSMVSRYEETFSDGLTGPKGPRDENGNDLPFVELDTSRVDGAKPGGK